MAGVNVALVGIAVPSTQVFNHGGGDASRGGRVVAAPMRKLWVL